MFFLDGLCIWDCIHNSEFEYVVARSFEYLWFTRLIICGACFPFFVLFCMLGYLVLYRVVCAAVDTRKTIRDDDTTKDGE